MKFCISILLSEKIPEVGDQLVNVIGLERQLEKTETDLLKASIERKALNSLRFNFRNSISITDQKKILNSININIQKNKIGHPAKIRVPCTDIHRSVRRHVPGARR